LGHLETVIQELHIKRYLLRQIVFSLNSSILSLLVL